MEDAIDRGAPGDGEPERVRDEDRQPGGVALTRRQARVFEAEPQSQCDELVGRELVGRGRNAAGRDRRPAVDHQCPQHRERRKPEQAAPNGTQRDEISGHSGGSHERFSMGMMCCGVTPCLAVCMTSIAVVCGSATLGTPGATPDWECATDAAESTAIRNGSMPCIGAPLDAVWYRATSSKEYGRTLLRQKNLLFHKALDK